MYFKYKKNYLNEKMNFNNLLHFNLKKIFNYVNYFQILYLFGNY
jgi:hypothetical protein